MNALTLAELRNSDRLIPQLVARGLSREAAEGKTELFHRVADRLLADAVPGDTAPVAWFVPGRIEVLGKHTDYAGGRSMLVAVERGFCVAAVPRSDSMLRVADALTGESVSCEFGANLAPAAGHWSNYPLTVARRMARNFPGVRGGAEIVFASDLPGSAGMSSSSALIVATFLALAPLTGVGDRAEYRRNVESLEDLAGYLGTVENGLSFGTLAGDRGVGTFGGSEDHTAILCARAGRVSQYSYCPVRFERTVEMPADWLFVIGVSGVVAEKTGTAMEKYNRVSRRAAALSELWRAATERSDPHLAAALASGPRAAERLREIVGRSAHGDFSADELLLRLEQFVAESDEIIPAVEDDLADGLSQFGELVGRSQALAARCLGNQTPETLWLADAARQFGAVAASAFGAGFGGSVWALVRTDRAIEMLTRWSEHYSRAFPGPAANASFFTTRAGPAAFRIDDQKGTEYVLPPSIAVRSSPLAP